jgi:hypothetical protein
VYQYNAAASRTSGSQSAALWFALAAGNTNPQGIADPPVATANGSTVDSLGQSAALISAADSASSETAIGMTTIRPAERSRSAPARRPTNFSANVQASEDFNLLIGSRTAFEPAGSEAEDPGASVATDKTAAIDAAFATLDGRHRVEIATEIALEV